MALTTSKLSRSPSLTDRNTISRSCGTTPSFESLIQLSPVHPSQIEHRHWRRGRLLSVKPKFSKDILRYLCGKPLPTHGGTRGSSVLCFSARRPNTEATECARQSGDSSNIARQDKSPNSVHIVRQIALHFVEFYFSLRDAKRICHDTTFAKPMGLLHMENSDSIFG